MTLLKLRQKEQQEVEQNHLKQETRRLKCVKFCKLLANKTLQGVLLLESNRRRGGVMTQIHFYRPKVDHFPITARPKCLIPLIP